VDFIAADETGGGADLVTRIRDGDRRAEAELVERYSRGVSLIIRRAVGQAAAAEDLSQETFRLALEKIRRGEVREPEKLSGFVCALARNLVIEHFRRAAREARRAGPEVTEALPAAAPGPLEEVLRKEKAAAVRQVIAELKSERDRQLLFRFYIAEEEKGRICEDLDLTALHFNQVLFRARARFKELYQRATREKKGE